MSFIDLAKKRYSVRKFKSEQIKEEELNLILEACNIAPTGCNNQPHRIYVLQSADAIAKADTITPCRYNAPTVLLMTLNTDEDWKNPKAEGERAGIQDVSIVASHAMLEAADIDIGTLWINNFDNRLAEKTFNIPENERAVLLMAVGYPADESKPAWKHEAVKPLSDTVRYL